jgi:hypothetical protein
MPLSYKAKHLRIYHEKKPLLIYLLQFASEPFQKVAYYLKKIVSVGYVHLNGYFFN